MKTKEIKKVAVNVNIQFSYLDRIDKILEKILQQQRVNLKNLISKENVSALENIFSSIEKNNNYTHLEIFCFLIVLKIIINKKNIIKLFLDQLSLDSKSKPINKLLKNLEDGLKVLGEENFEIKSISFNHIPKGVRKISLYFSEIKELEKPVNGKEGPKHIIRRATISAFIIALTNKIHRKVLNSKNLKTNKSWLKSDCLKEYKRLVKKLEMI